MEVDRFRGEYEEIAAIHERLAEELRRRDAARGLPVQRWVARVGGSPAATATLTHRPDERRFLHFVGDPAAVVNLVAAVAAETDTDLFVSAAPGERARLEAAGFFTEVVWEQFEVPFAGALDALRLAFPPRHVTLKQAGEVDPRRLFALDNELRSRVAGTDNWKGNWDWFRAELADPAAYLVAVDASDRYYGLARIWRNAGGPRFGLIGVTTAARNGRIGPYLLRRTLEQASEWGFESFTAETGTQNPWIHHRLERIASRRLGTRMQMVRPA